MRPRLLVGVAAVAVAATGLVVGCQPGPPKCEGLTATIVGTSGDNILVGTSGRDVIAGLAGKDSIAGLAGNDIICGGSGIDDIHGGDNNDVIDGGPDPDTLRGGQGSDTVSYRSSTVGVLIDLFGGTGPGGEYLNDIENVTGTPYADRLIGDNGDNWLVGLDGSDDLFGYPGNDRLVDGGTSSSATNLFSGGAGNDIFTGGPAVDSVSFHTFDPTSGVLVDLAAGIASGDGQDVLSDIDAVYATDSNDILIGDGGPNTLNGFRGDDVVVGAGGDDLLEGGLGRDQANWFTAIAAVDANLVTDRAVGEGTDTLSSIEDLRGGIGNDTLTGDHLANVIDGGPGFDTCTGGGGLDTLLECP